MYGEHRITYTFLLICLLGSSKEDVKSCPSAIIWDTKHFTSWYGNFQSNAYKLENDITSDTIQQLYYKGFSYSQPFKCTIQKSIGGQWAKLSDHLSKVCEDRGDCESWPQMDGAKKICMDTLYSDVKSDSCLIYSFGLSDDWTFEEYMAHMGCKVRGFDPTIDGPPEGFDWPKSLSFFRTGISNETSDRPLLENIGINDLFHIDTLENIIDRMDDRGKKITILKLDVEGYEFKILPQILKGNILDIIDQMVLEIHSNDHEERNLDDMKSMLSNLQNLYSKGRRIINYDPNLTIERMFSKSQNYYPNFDITMIKNI